VCDVFFIVRAGSHPRLAGALDIPSFLLGEVQGRRLCAIVRPSTQPSDLALSFAINLRRMGLLAYRLMGRAYRLPCA